MEKPLLCRELEDLIERVGIVIRYESFDDPEFRASSGLCRVKGQTVLLIDEGATLGKKIEVFVECLNQNQADLQNIYVKPAVRDYLVGFSKKRKEGVSETVIT